MRSLILMLTAFVSLNAFALDPIRIDIGKNYKDYSNEELRRRVYDLERAVAQLQNQVFQLAMRDGGGMGAPAPGATWTCQIEPFTTNYVASGNTRASALALVLKKCGDATDPMHCKENKAKCTND